MFRLTGLPRGVVWYRAAAGTSAAVQDIRLLLGDGRAIGTAADLAVLPLPRNRSLSRPGAALASRRSGPCPSAAGTERLCRRGVAARCAEISAPSRQRRGLDQTRANTRAANHLDFTVARAQSGIRRRTRRVRVRGGIVIFFPPARLRRFASSSSAIRSNPSAATTPRPSAPWSRSTRSRLSRSRTCWPHG